jgi:hypothetical protein
MTKVILSKTVPGIGLEPHQHEAQKRGVMKVDGSQMWNGERFTVWPGERDGSITPRGKAGELLLCMNIGLTCRQPSFHNGASSATRRAPLSPSARPVGACGSEINARFRPACFQQNDQSIHFRNSEKSASWLQPLHSKEIT